MVIGVYSAVEVDNIYPLIFHHLWCEISPCLDAVITTEKHFDLLTSSYRFRQQEQFCCLFLWVTVPLTSRMWIVIIFKKRSVVVMKLEIGQRRWCADAKQKTQTDSDAGGGIWQNRLTPKR